MRSPSSSSPIESSSSRNSPNTIRFFHPRTGVRFSRYLASFAIIAIAHTLNILCRILTTLVPQQSIPHLTLGLLYSTSLGQPAYIIDIRNSLLEPQDLFTPTSCSETDCIQFLAISAINHTTFLISNTSFTPSNNKSSGHLSTSSGAPKVRSVDQDPHLPPRSCTNGFYQTQTTELKYRPT